jgi:hypothetical protein
MRLEVTSHNGDGMADAVTVLNWAYNDGSNPVNLGITVPGGSVPEPSALGLLALGSAGVLAWRRRNRNAER